MHKNYLKNITLQRRLLNPVTLLFIQHDENIHARRVTHAHAFWQLEYIISGSVEIKSGRNKLKAGTDDCILIPPGCPHCFIYDDRPQSSWSIKFDTEVAIQPETILVLKKSDHSLNIRHLLLAELNKHSFSGESFLVIESLTGLLAELELQTRQAASAELTIIDHVKMFIDNKAGKRITVNEVAVFAGCSRNHISSLFHKETGVKLKTFIDEQRIETARKMLQYSNLKIAEIAGIMEFSDVFSFSRFFFRNSGEYPSKFREQKQFKK